MTSNFLKSINLQKLIQVNLLILVNYANQSEDRKVQNSTTPVLVAVICGELEQVMTTQHTNYVVKTHKVPTV